MTRTAKWLIAIGAVLVAVLAALGIRWLASHMRPTTTRIDVGFQGEARRNPYLACERMLRDLGLDARSESSLARMPPDDGVLFIGSQTVLASARLAHDIAAWVERGGNLIVLLPSRGPRRAELVRRLRREKFECPLADELGLVCHAVEAEVKHDTNPMLEALGVEDDIPSDREESSSLEALDLGSGPLSVKLADQVWFEDIAATAKFSAGEPARMLSLAHGAGWATFVVSDGWMTNSDIDLHDHAQFAWELANLVPSRSVAWLVLGENPPGLLALLARNAWMVLASLAALIVVWVWKSGARFGPMLPVRSRDVRDFAEHVTASAEFLWRHAAANALLAAPRTELRRRIQLFRPDLAELEPAALERELAQIAALDIDAVHEALALVNTRNAHQFTRVVRNLATLRQNL